MYGMLGIKRDLKEDAAKDGEAIKTGTRSANWMKTRDRDTWALREKYFVREATPATVEKKL